MKVSSERPLLLYCESCSGMGKFGRADDQEIAGMLGLANHRGKLLWRAPCAGPGCTPNRA